MIFKLKAIKSSSCWAVDNNNNIRIGNEEMKALNVKILLLKKNVYVLILFQGFCLSLFAKSGRRGERIEESSALPGSSTSSRCLKTVYTPLEQQVIQLKQQHKDALLAVECGYKYRFFGEDAEVRTEKNLC